MFAHSSKRLAVVLVGLLGAALTAGCILDQQQPQTNPSAGTVLIGGSQQQQLAQTVTAGWSGDLVEVRLPLFCLGASDEITVEIQETSAGQPSGVVLAQTSFVPGTNPGTPVFVRVVFPEPAYIADGTLFAIVLSSGDICGVYGGPDEDSYAGGTLYARSLPTNIWTQAYDLPFRTIVNIFGRE